MVLLLSLCCVGACVGLGHDMALPRRQFGLRAGGASASGSPCGVGSLSVADVKIAGSAACGSYIQGYTTGVLGGSLLFLTPYFRLTPQEVGLVATATTVGSVVGTLSAARLADAAGRQRTMALSSVLFLASSGLLCWTPSLRVLLLARFVAGVGIGNCGAVVPVRRRPRLFFSSFPFARSFALSFARGSARGPAFDGPRCGRSTSPSARRRRRAAR